MEMDEVKLSANLPDDLIGNRLFEKWKIKIGGPGKEVTSRNGKKFRPPKKYDHFVICKNYKDPATGMFVKDEDAHVKVGKDKPDSLNIFFYSNDISDFWRTYLGYYNSQGRFCHGDGINAKRLQKDGGYKTIDCDPGKCEFYKEGVCKMNGVLQFGLSDVSRGLGGVAVFRTTGRNTIRAINSMVRFYLKITKGNIAGILFRLIWQKQQTKTKDGVATSIPVVSLEYAGTFENLRKRALSVKKEEVAFESGINVLNGPSGKKVSGEVFVEEAITDGDIADEFYPENTSPDIEEEVYEEFVGEVDGPSPVGDPVDPTPTEEEVVSTVEYSEEPESIPDEVLESDNMDLFGE